MHANHRDKFFFEGPPGQLVLRVQLIAGNFNRSILSIALQFSFTLFTVFLSYCLVFMMCKFFPYKNTIITNMRFVYLNLYSIFIIV